MGGLGAGTLNQQNLITLFSAVTSTAAPTQATTGACSTAGVTYWDLGVRGDNEYQRRTRLSGFTLNPQYSVLTPGTTGYSGATHTTYRRPAVHSASTATARDVPPECTTADGCGGLNGFGVPPGIADAVVPNPIFSLVPSATVDEGNNWINVSWGPLVDDELRALAGYIVRWRSRCSATHALQGLRRPSIRIPTSLSVRGLRLPTSDFFGNPRPDTGNPNAIDAGAIEVASTGGRGG